jgi:AcrR family transcriptional regulator
VEAGAKDAGASAVLAEPVGGAEAGIPAPGEAKRADARRNRAQILASAEAVFAEEGLGVPVDEVARRAGVGVGTLYRHFPTKEALFEAVILHHIETLRDSARALAQSDQPGEALFLFLGHLAREGAVKRNLVEALSGAGISITDTAGETKEELEQAAGYLLERAQKAGQVRADVTLHDLVGLVMGACNAAGSDTSGCSSERMIAIVCDGLRGGGRPGDEPAA